MGHFGYFKYCIIVKKKLTGLLLTFKNALHT